MKKFIYLLMFSITVFSCKKEKSNSDDCDPNLTTSRVLVNRPATVLQPSDGQFYLIEHGTIDSKLLPCNLATAFKVHNLAVTISGDVKATVQGGPDPCCIEYFVITKISL